MENKLKKEIDGTESSRRKFLKTAGKFALYTPPALMVMTGAGTQAFAKSNCNNGGGNGTEGCDASQQENSNNDGDR